MAKRCLEGWRVGHQAENTEGGEREDVNGACCVEDLHCAGGSSWRRPYFGGGSGIGVGCL